MVFTKRERMVGIIVGLGVGLVLLDQYVVEPFVGYRDQLQADIKKLTRTKGEDQDLIKAEAKVTEDWRKLLVGGLRENPSQAESQLLDNLQRWQTETNLRITAFHQDRAVGSKDGPQVTLASTSGGASKQPPQPVFMEVPFHATGNGRMADAAAMIWALETAPMPLRINSIQLSPQSGREASDNLMVQFNLTALCLNTTPEPEKPAAGAAAKKE